MANHHHPHRQFTEEEWKEIERRIREIEHKKNVKRIRQFALKVFVVLVVAAILILKLFS